MVKKAKMGGAPGYGSNLSNHQESAAPRPPMKGTPGGASVTPSRQRKGAAKPYQGSPAHTPGMGGAPGGRNC